MLLRLLTALLVLIVTILVLPRLVTTYFASSRSFQLQDIPSRPVAIVFGAGLRRDGTPSPVLRDRVAAAAQLYTAGKVQKLLMSGGSYFNRLHEAHAMRDYALTLGVRVEDIVLDESGERTYDTCYRARSIYGIDRAILVTQQFHLPRALYLCSHLGVDAVGYPADLRPYRSRSQLFWHTREFLATFVALWDVHIGHPLPILGQPEPIVFDKEV